MSKHCVRCEKTVYPIEELKCLDKIWHKTCFKCYECGMILNMKSYKGFNKMPYCNAHCPQARATTVVDTPETRRLAENTKIQSQAKYHAEFEKQKGKLTQVADDPETLRIRNASKIISNVSYHGDYEKKKQMEERRNMLENESVNSVNNNIQPYIANATSDKSSKYIPAAAYSYTDNNNLQQSSNSAGAGFKHPVDNVKYHQRNQYSSYNNNAVNNNGNQIEPNKDYFNKAAAAESTVPVPNQGYPQANVNYATDARYANSQSHHQQPQHQQHPQHQLHPQHPQHPQQSQQMPSQYYQQPHPQMQQPHQMQRPPQPQLIYHHPNNSNPYYQASHQQKPVHASQKLGRCFRAIYDYTAQDVDEVSFLDGDLLIHCQPIDDGWMTGTVQRTMQTGMLPSNYVESV